MYIENKKDLDSCKPHFFNLRWGKSPKYSSREAISLYAYYLSYVFGNTFGPKPFRNVFMINLYRDSFFDQIEVLFSF